MFLIAALLLSGCEEDVVVNLKQIEKKLVVEATLTNEAPAIKVTLSYSEGFYDTPDFYSITDAAVWITDQNGNKTNLNIHYDSLFHSGFFEPVVGEDYHLNISVDDRDFEVSTYLPEQVPISSVFFVQNPFWETADSLNAYVYVEDPKGEDNYFRLFVNKMGRETIGEFYLVEDVLGKDGTIIMPVYYKNYSPGDTVVVELRHLTRSLYEYYLGLTENISGSFNSIAPGNPVSNMPEDVYGVFAGYSVARDTVIVNAFSF